MSLCLCSTAPLCINMHAQLWFQRTTHPSPCDSGASDNGPVLAPHAEQEAFTLDRERFTQARRSCLEPDRSVGKVPVGEPSLSGEPECLSLHVTILAHKEKAEMATQPPKPQRRTRHSSRPVNGDGHPASIFVNKCNQSNPTYSHFIVTSY